MHRRRAKYGSDESSISVGSYVTTPEFMYGDTSDEDSYDGRTPRSLPSSGSNCNSNTSVEGSTTDNTSNISSDTVPDPNEAYQNAIYNQFGIPRNFTAELDGSDDTITESPNERVISVPDDTSDDENSLPLTLSDDFTEDETLEMVENGAVVSDDVGIIDNGSMDQIMDVLAASVSQTEPAVNVSSMADQPSSSNQATESVESAQTSQSAENAADPVNTPSRKRRRSTALSATASAVIVETDNDADDGLTCSICFEAWRVSGEHRLVCLKCGHLFGHHCVLRWLKADQLQKGVGQCPQCKAPAFLPDIRPIFAKRVLQLDTTVEDELRASLAKEVTVNCKMKSEMSSLKCTVAQLNMSYEFVIKENEQLKRKLRLYEAAQSTLPAKRYKLHLINNVAMSKLPGGRVMTYSANNEALFIAQNCGKTLFNGYGVRVVDVNILRQKFLIHTNKKIIADLYFCDASNSLAVASLEKTLKLYDVRQRHVRTTFEPSEHLIHSCCISDNHVYSGTTGGQVYVQDLRGNPNHVVRTLSSEDRSHVIAVKVVRVSEKIGCGGVLVCNLTTVWWSPSDPEKASYPLLVDGPFQSMNYNEEKNTLLLSTRFSARNNGSYFIYGELECKDIIIRFKELARFKGSQRTPTMTRCAQMFDNDDPYILGYLQDQKAISLFDVTRMNCVHNYQTFETVYDMTPFMAGGEEFLAALAETNLKVFKLANVNTV